MKKTLALAVAAVCITGSCTSGDDTAKAPASLGADACPTAALDGVNGVVDVTLWRHLAPQDGAAFEQLVTDFNGSHPHVKVTVVAKVPGTSLANDVLNSEADKGPDVAMLVDEAVRPAIDRNLLVPAQACLDTSHTTLADVLPGALASAAIDGKQWGVPWGASGSLLFYDRAAFRRAGLDPDRPPTTLDDVSRASRAIVASGSARTGLAIIAFAPLFLAAGVAPEHPDTPAGVAVAAWLAQARADGSVQLPAEGQDYASLLAVGSGQAAMAIESTLAIPEITAALRQGQAPGVDLGIAPIPTPSGPPGVPQSANALYLVANSSAERRAAAWSFLTWLTEPPQQARLAAATPFLPVNTKAAAIDPLATRWRDVPELAAAWNALRTGPSARDPLAVPGRELGDELQFAGLRVFLHGADPHEAMTEAGARAATDIAGYLADPARYRRCGFAPTPCRFDVDLYVLPTDGSQQVPLTPDKAFDAAPTWSPDGSRVAFASNVINDTDVYVVDADGSNRRQLTKSPGVDTTPAWSPDGTRIAFTSERLGKPDVYTMAPDGSDVRRLTTSPDGDRDPSWSPDGRQIAFVHETAEGGLDIWVIDAAGGNPRSVASAPETDWQPAWSPDGTRIAFVSERTGHPAVFLMNADGSDQHAIMPSRSQGKPAWSPDGRELVVVELPYHQLYVMPPDGSAYRRVTTSLDYFNSPAWSPDGTRIVASANRWPTAK